jgi:hypothetical protein
VTAFASLLRTPHPTTTYENSARLADVHFGAGV